MKRKDKNEHHLYADNIKLQVIELPLPCGKCQISVRKWSLRFHKLKYHNSYLPLLFSGGGPTDWNGIGSQFIKPFQKYHIVYTITFEKSRKMNTITFPIKFSQWCSLKREREREKKRFLLCYRQAWSQVDNLKWRRGKAHFEQTYDWMKGEKMNSGWLAI